MNQFAKMRLIERARRATSGRSSSGARQHGAPRNSLNSRTYPLLPSPEIPSEAAKTTASQGVPRGSVLVGTSALDHPSPIVRPAPPGPAPAVRTRSLLLPINRPPSLRTSLQTRRGCSDHINYGMRTYGSRVPASTSTHVHVVTETLTLITDPGRSYYHCSGKGGSCPIIWLWFCCACIFWSCIMAWSRWYRLRMA